MNQGIRESGVMNISIPAGVCTPIIMDTNFCISVW